MPPHPRTRSRRQPQLATSQAAVGPSEQAAGRESTRSKIAQYYVGGYFGIIVIVLLLGIGMRFTVDEYRDILLAVSGILSGPLGFIIGFYFKSDKD